MSEIWDLSQYVEAHPDSYRQRWRLAKKLYKANEHRLALEHLQVLKNNWEPKLNVTRYLAATYFRLSRHDEAIRELEGAVEDWPHEIGLHEQLALVYEAAGQAEEAAGTWGGILARAPEHKMAAREQERLTQLFTASSPRAASMPLVEPPISLESGSACPRCGARNSDEFDRCWKCHAPLDVDSAGVPQFDLDAEGTLDRPAGGMAGILLTGLAIAAALATGVYLTLNHISTMQSAPVVARTVQELFAREFLLTRAVTALALLLAWPASFLISAALVNTGRVSVKRCAAAGVFLASLTYALSWMPISVAAYAILIPIFAALAILALFFNLPFGQAAAAWLLHSVLVLTTTAVAIGALEGFDFLTGFPAMAKFARTHDTGPGAGSQDIGPFNMRVDSTVLWEDTGSAWLNGKAGKVMFEIEMQEPSESQTIELKDIESGDVILNRITTSPFTFVFDALPGRQYGLVMDGRQGAKVDITLHGILRHRLGEG